MLMDHQRSDCTEREIWQDGFQVRSSGPLVFYSRSAPNYVTPGGEIECLGRKDNQVKIHGHRIELAEIEQAIVRSNMVQGEGALVLAARLSQGLQLAAFCIFSPSTSATVQDPTHYHDRIRQLRRQLGTLATYMVPKYILPMGTFPKLPSRKTDRKLLKKLIEEMDSATLAQFASDGPVIKPDFVAVDTDAEIALVSMWSSLFELPPSGLGKKANFLSLGGDSITAIRLAGMARNAGYLLSVQAVLKSPVLEEMAVLMKGDVATQRSVANRQYETPPGAVEILRASGLRMDADVEYSKFGRLESHPSCPADRCSVSMPTRTGRVSRPRGT